MMLQRSVSILILIIVGATSKLMSQKMTPEQVVQNQLEAYNQRDINAFMSVIDPKVTFHNFSEGVETMKGRQACKEFYAALFEASPNLHSKIITRTVFGNKIIDHESITGRNGNDEPLELVLIYEVQNEKISKVTVLKKQK